MKIRVRSGKKRRCPVCGEGKLIARRITEKFEHGRDNDRVTVQARDVPVETCRACRETFSGPEAARVRHAATCKAHGLLPPTEIKSLRERLGMTQAQFARLTGISEPSLSRWERGRLLQSKALDRFLRLLRSNPESIKLLEKISSARDDSPAGSEPTTTDQNRQGPGETIGTHGQFGMGKAHLLYSYLATLISAWYQGSKARTSDSEITDILGPRFIECKTARPSHSLDSVAQQLAAHLERLETKLRVMVPSSSSKSGKRFVWDIGPGEMSENRLAEHVLQLEDALSDVPDPQRDELVNKLVGIVDLLKRSAS